MKKKVTHDMRYIILQEIKPDIPAKWFQSVKKARKTIAGNMRKARNKVRAEDGSIAVANLAAMDARANGIKARSRIWRMLDKQLAKASSGKCWYCQSNDIRSYKPIDHFRPKGAVNECSAHSGYWWLAFNWENYRYACTFCNSAHQSELDKSGKQDHFPLLDETDRQMKPGTALNEVPLLLDPCKFGDNKLITFNVKGEVIANSARVQAGTDDSKKVETSIGLYDLNHEDIRRKRETIYDDIAGLVADINEDLKYGFAVNHERITKKQTELLSRIRNDSNKYDFNVAAYAFLKSFSPNNAWVEDIIEELR
jgi:uncharacterized protein (TIGR02646 family)